MKKTALISFILIVCITTSFAKLINKEASGIMTVTTSHYKIKFFPKHMLPYEIEISGKKLKPEFIDRLYQRKSKRQYFLNKDRFAKLKVVSDNGKTAVITATGTYCYDNSTSAPGNVKAVYTYKFSKTSPVINVTAVVTKSNDTQWSELRFLQPGFKINPFSKLLNYKSKSAVNLTKRVKNEMFYSPGWSIFSDGKIAFGIAGKHTLAWNDFKKTYCSYLCRAAIRNWKSRKIKLSGKLYLGSARKRNEYNKLFNASSKKRDITFSLKSSSYKVIIGPKNSTIRKIIFKGTELGTQTGWYGTIFAEKRCQFIGAGHNEGGVEKVLFREVTVDGKKCNIQNGSIYSGKKVVFKKVSMLANIKVNMVLTVTPGEINITKNFQAVEDQKAYSMYVFQFCWTNKMTNWIACLDDNSIKTGNFLGKTEKFLLNKPKVKYLVEYSDSFQKGIIMFFNDIYTCRNNTFWNRKVYKKYYMMLKVPKVYRKGFNSKTYHIRLKGFNSTKQNLQNKVQKIVSEMQ
jgi:hypothetical protein